MLLDLRASARLLAVAGIMPILQYCGANQKREIPVEYELSWVRRPAHSPISTKLTGKRVLVLCEEGLSCIDIRTGRLLWRVAEFRSREFQMEVLGGEVILIGPRLTSVRVEDGAIVAARDAKMWGPIVTTRKTLYVGTDLGVIGLNHQLETQIEMSVSERPLLLTASEDSLIVATEGFFHVFGLIDPAPKGTISVPGSNANLMTLQVQGDHLVAGYTDRIDVWSLMEGKRIWTMPQGAPLVKARRWRNSLITNSAREIVMRRLEDGTLERTMSTGCPISGFADMEIVRDHVLIGTGKRGGQSPPGERVHVRRTTPGLCVFNLDSGAEFVVWAETAGGPVSGLFDAGGYVLLSTTEGWLIAMRQRSR